MVKAFYNEIDPYAAQWLKNLSEAGHIAEGFVETRSIVDLKPKDLKGYTQHHFFGGIGGWSRALRLAGWPDDEEVWTGSCPCTPFSQAGRGRGFKDERHLWPTWFELIRECRPRAIIGEQVSSPDGLRWLDLVYSDLELSGYSVWAVNTCAPGVGAPHIRQRLYFVAVANDDRSRRLHVQSRKQGEEESESAGRSKACELGNPSGSRSRRNSGTVPRAKEEVERERIESRSVAHESESTGTARLMGDPSGARSQIGPGPEERFGAIRIERDTVATPGATAGFWADAEWWLCRDGKARPAKPGAFPLVDGLPRGMARLRPSRVGVLRGIGNAIVPQQAEVFIRAVAPLIGVQLQE